jgi:hypothetical protein
MTLLASQGGEGFFKSEIELDETYFGGKGKRGEGQLGKSLFSAFTSSMGR